MAEDNRRNPPRSPDETIPAPAAPAPAAHPPRPPHRNAEGPGARIGPYKILQLLGEGGFGTVFLAEQKQPFDRRVALKIIKLGMDTKEVIARFDAERHALGRMDHPNIAKVFDAGATDTGRPYFVMELVRGSGGHVSLYDASTGKALGRNLSTGAGSAPSGAIRLLANGRFALFGLMNIASGRLEEFDRWDVDSGKKQRAAAPSTAGFREVFIPNERVIISTDNGSKRRRIWDAASLIEIPAESEQAWQVMGAGAVSLMNAARARGMSMPITTCEEGVFAAVLSDEMPPRTWRPASRIHLGRISEPKFDQTLDSGVDVLGVAIPEDGEAVFEACADGNIRVFCTRTGELVRIVPAHAGTVNSIAVSSDGRVLVSGGTDQILRIWNLGSATEIYTLESGRAAACAELKTNPSDSGALKLLGEWYFVNRQWEWASELLCQARDKGAVVSSLMLARCCWMNGDLDAADKAFNEALASKEAAEHYLTLCISAVRSESVRSPRWLARVASVQQLYTDGMDAEYFAAMEELVHSKPYDRNLYVNRSTAYGELGKFKEAKAELERLPPIDDVDPRYWHAILSVYLMDVNAYRQDCELLLPHFSDNNPYYSDKSAKALLLVPGVAPDLRQIAAAIDQKLKSRTDIDLWLYLCKGMAEYRRGKYDVAIDWLKKAEANEVVSAVLTAQLFEAMSRFKAKRLDEGRKLFAAATARIDHDLAKPGAGRMVGYENWPTCQIARREAEKLLK